MNTPHSDACVFFGATGDPAFKKTKPYLAGACAVGLIPLGMPGIARAAEVNGQLFDHQPQRAWLENYDPTLVSSRVVSEFSYESQDNDANFYKIETTLRWGIPLRDGLALGLQMMVPVKWNESPASQESGLGDLELRTGVVGRISPTMRYGIGLNAAFNTASDSALGDNAFVLRPITAIRWDITDSINLGLNLEYNFTPFDEGTHDVSALELKLPLAFKISEDWSAALTYKPKWNVLSDTDQHRLELGATRQWGSHNQYALSFGTEVPLTSETLKFKLITGFAWCF